METKTNSLEIIRHAEISGLTMFFNTLDYRTPHLHPEWEVLWVLDQPLTLRSVQKTYRAEAGEMILINPFQPHEICKVERSCTFLCLQILPELFASGYPQIDHLSADDPYLSAHFSRNQQREIQKALMDMMRSYLDQQPGYELFCIGQGALLLRTLFQGVPCHLLTSEEIDARDRRNARLSRLLRFVDENYGHKIRLADFAKQEGLTLSYASAFVKTAMNQNFQEYVNTVRFNAACQQIAAGSRRMQDVCMEAGFSDYRYFSNTFRQRTGMTPEQYCENPPAVLDAQQTHHSLHSLERFYSRQRSRELLENYRNSTISENRKLV